MNREPDDLAERQALDRVEAKIAAAVRTAPPLRDDLASRLATLIRTSPAIGQTGAAA
ncbi:hypothetical protein HDA40_006102 [Hamadaea flava]|nr:hypothetical protein [Hamadaea flava]